MKYMFQYKRSSECIHDAICMIKYVAPEGWAQIYVSQTKKENSKSGVLMFHRKKEYIFLQHKNPQTASTTLASYMSMRPEHKHPAYQNGLTG